jgi:hypothetical protein
VSSAATLAVLTCCTATGRSGQRRRASRCVRDVAERRAASCDPPTQMRPVLIAVRYGLPAVVVLGGVIALAIDPSSWDGAAAVIGAGLSIALLNVLHRMGVDGDVDRDREAAARAYFDAHGRWPDEDAPGVPGA